MITTGAARAAAEVLLPEQPHAGRRGGRGQLCIEPRGARDGRLRGTELPHAGLQEPGCAVGHEWSVMMLPIEVSEVHCRQVK